MTRRPRGRGAVGEADIPDGEAEAETQVEASGGVASAVATAHAGCERSSAEATTRDESSGRPLGAEVSQEDMEAAHEGLKAKVRDMDGWAALSLRSTTGHIEALALSQTVIAHDDASPWVSPELFRSVTFHRRDGAIIVRVGERSLGPKFACWCTSADNSRCVCAPGELLRMLPERAASTRAGGLKSVARTWLKVLDVVSKAELCQGVSDPLVAAAQRGDSTVAAHSPAERVTFYNEDGQLVDAFVHRDPGWYSPPSHSLPPVPAHYVKLRRGPAADSAKTFEKKWPSTARAASLWSCACA